MSSPPLVIPPKTWTRLPGTEWEVWHTRKNVMILGSDHHGTRLVVRQRPDKDPPITPRPASPRS